MRTTYSPERPATRTRQAARDRRHVDWSILSPQGRVLFYIALCPGCSVQEIAVALSVTERSVWNVIRDLRRAEMINYSRGARRHRYTVNLDAPLFSPTIEGLTLRPVLGRLTEESLRSQQASCVRIA